MPATRNFTPLPTRGQSPKPFTFDNIFRATVIALVGIVAIVALALSYDALYQMAEKHGHSGWKSYAWPALIDLPLVVFTVVMLYAQVKQMGGWTIAGLLGLVLAYTGATVYLNYLESDGSIEGVFVRVAAPVGLFVCTEVLRHLLKFEIDHKGKAMTLAQMTAHIDQAKTELDRLNVQTEHRRQEAEQLTHQRDNLQAEIDNLMTAQSDHERVTYRGNVTPLNDARQSQMEQRRMELLPLLDSDLTQKELAERFNVTPQTIRRDIKALKDEGYLNDDSKQGQSSFDGLIDALPMDETGKEALRQSINGNQGDAQ